MKKMAGCVKGVLVCGDGGAGKTQWIYCLEHEKMQVGYHDGIQIDFLIKYFHVDRRTWAFPVWDYHHFDRDRNENVFQQRLDHCSFSFLFVDMSKELDVNFSIYYWIDQINRHTPHIKYCLVGTKCDLKRDKNVELLSKIAKEQNVDVFFISTKGDVDKNRILVQNLYHIYEGDDPFGRKPTENNRGQSSYCFLL